LSQVLIIGKGNSGNNVACEGLFGRMKTKTCYGVLWNKASEFDIAINGYINFYNSHRIKMSVRGADKILDRD